MPNRQTLRKEGAMDIGKRDGWRYEEERETPSVSVCSKSGQVGVCEIIKRTQSHSTAIHPMQLGTSNSSNPNHNPELLSVGLDTCYGITYRRELFSSSSSSLLEKRFTPQLRIQLELKERNKSVRERE
ncbi:hypothetical protein DPX16_23050 [Anabarilius grahami]|uniref:Uncharacterized protein n=1 Tax=Anabarilius grahami TaxID=495550 RepID=A0A3N0XIC3_ANAGA|nr:hypothetical protein DPX16_23050 [Anabarilius grahami]